MFNQEQVSNLFNSFEMNFRHMADHIGYENTRPSVLHKLIPFRDGSEWCVLLGENIQCGICGFGDTPDKAMRSFDAEYVSTAKDN